MLQDYTKENHHSYHTVTLESLAYGGDAVCHVDGQAVFVPDGVPGDKALIEILVDKGTYSRGKIRELLTASSDRTEPFCPFAERCGGCQWQMISYTSQLEWKRTIVEETLRRIGKFENVEVEPCAASPVGRSYRTVGRYPSRTTNRPVVFGYHERRSHRIVDIASCPVATERVNAIASNIRAILDEEPDTCNIREITIRSSYNEPSSLISLTVSPGKQPGESMLRRLSEIDAVAGVIVRADGNDGAARRLFSIGSSRRLETIHGARFRVDERSFFQIHIPQTEHLVTIVREMIEGEQCRKLVDGYGGVGLFSLCCAPDDADIILFDTSEPAVKDSIFNAQECGLSRFSAFRSGAVEVLNSVGTVDVLILDPPRTGLGYETVQAAASTNAGTIVYVSCNPTTLARDLALLCERGYRIGRVVPVDMFPQTYHIETAVKLKRC